MKSPAFDYHCPTSVAEAVQLLAQDNVTLLAGGQSLVPMMNFRLLAPAALIDINNIVELGEMTISDSKISFGAMVRQRCLERDEALKKIAPIFGEAVLQIGHRQTRNRGTIGGSLCHLDPSAELPALCVLHDARLTLAGQTAKREVSIHDFIKGAMANGLSAGEMLTHVEITPWPKKHGYAFIEHARRAGDFALSSASCLMTLDQSGAVDRIAICVGGLGDKPVRLRQTEAAAKGMKFSQEIMDAADHEARSCSADGSLHASADFKRQIAATLAKRALRLAYERASGGGA
jgi:carbon-monoxide dehydrogenase medium subunit